MTADPVVISFVFLYLGGMLGIGYYASRKISANEDFMVAGRRLGPVMMAGTLAATEVGGGISVGVAEKAYGAWGLSAAWYVLAMTITFLILAFVAPKLRAATEVGGGSSMGVAEKAYGAWGLSAAWYVLAMTITFLILAFVAPKLRAATVKTVPEYFRRRYGPSSSLLTALIMIFPLIGLTAIQFIASSVIVSVMTGMSYRTSVLLVVAVVTTYSVLGGLWSVTLTDVVQWCLIVAGLIVAVPFALQYGGGWDALMQQVPARKLHPTQGMGLGTLVSLVIMYVASFAVGQEAVQRYYAARDERTARIGSLYAGLVYVVFAFVPALLGVIAFGLVQSGAIDGALIVERGERYVLPVLAVHVMPSWLVGIVFAALISATMSSADSDLLAAGSIFSNDLYGRLLRPHASESEILLVTRLTMVVIALAAMAVALTNTQNIITVLMFSFTLRAGGAFVPYVIGHYWQRAGTAGALASIVAGSITVVMAEHGVLPVGGVQPIIPGLGISLLAFLLFSRRNPDRRATVSAERA